METAGQSHSEKSAVPDEKTSDNRARRSRSRSGDADAERKCKRQALEQSSQLDASLEKSAAVPQELVEPTSDRGNQSAPEMSKPAISENEELPAPKEHSGNTPLEDVVTDADAGKSAQPEEKPFNVDPNTTRRDSDKLVENIVAGSEQQSVLKLPEPPAPPVPPVPRAPQVPMPAPHVVRPVVPPVPQVALPERTRLVVTIPLKLKTQADKSLADLRQQLVSAGCLGSEGAFYIKGDGKPLDDATRVGDLPDIRLLLSSEPTLQPWQLCLAHRTGQQLVAARAVSMGAALSLEAMISRNPYYKTKMCNQWVQNNGRCIRGPRCVYAHGPGEMRPPVVGALPRFFLPQMQAGTMRPGMPPFMLAGGIPRPASFSTPPVPQPSQPEVVFTVDEVEERKRAERARRFAPKDKASFELEEKDSKSKKSEDKVAAPANDSDAMVPAMEEGNDGLIQLPIPPMPPIGMLPGADGTTAMSEEEIADYLLEMEQQFMNTLGCGDSDQEFPLPPDFPMPQFPPPASASLGVQFPPPASASLGVLPPGVPLPEPLIPPLAANQDPTTNQEPGTTN